MSLQDTDKKKYADWQLLILALSDKFSREFIAKWPSKYHGLPM